MKAQPQASRKLSLRLIYGVSDAKRILRRPSPLDPGEMPPSLREKIKDVFGRALTVTEVVNYILQEVQAKGDEALLKLTERIDGVKLVALEVSKGELEEASQRIDESLLDALETAADRIRLFHRRVSEKGMKGFRGDGLGQLVRPLDRVGIYVPGGTAVYPSTVLMAAIPARVAGVREVVLATPPQRDGTIHPLVLAAAQLAKVDRIFKIGGAQAIAALALGTASVPRVDKICGPGNIFVQEAKRRVYGAVDIDAFQGPSEAVIIADDEADPAICAADLLAEAEHDPLSASILITTSSTLADEVQREAEKQLRDIERQEIAQEALERNGAVVVVSSIEEAIDLANSYAPEHLCLMVRDPEQYLSRISNAGAIFLGESSSHVMGDYIAGPSHVLPTGGTARFSSPLSVHDFLKVTSLVALTEEETKALAPKAATIARAEKLIAHARAVELRLSSSQEASERKRQG